MVVVSGEWRVGAAFDRSASVLAGVEGCSTSEFCLESRTRYAGRVEYHASPGETFAPWFALELGAERMNGYDTSTARYEPSNRTVPVILPQAGFDLLAPAGESRLGCGLFVGLPIGVAVGAQLGLRVVVGVM